MAQGARLRELSTWDEDYVSSLPTAEFDWIDYKASEKLTDPAWPHEMSKYVSAWANYDGGYILFGVRHSKDGSDLEIDGGVPLTCKPNLLDWLDDVIPGLVEPPLPKLSTCLIHPRATHSQINPGHVLVVIHVPESAISPHQARDRKYYQRLGRKLEPLRHRAVLDIIGRRRHPTLRTKILVHIGYTKPKIFWQLENTGSTMALHWKAAIRFPTKIGKSHVTVPNSKAILGCTEDGRSFVEFRISKALGSPLFPGSDISDTFDFGPCNYDPPLEPSIDYVQVTTFADDMPPFVEQFPLSEVLKSH
jgi:hypothetical protein